MKRHILPLMLLLCAGCASQQVPKSVVKLPGLGEFSLPKDTDIEELDIQTKDGTKIKIKKLKTRTNPDVVTASGASFVDGVKAGGDVFKQGLETGIKATGQAIVPGQ